MTTLLVIALIVVAWALLGAVVYGSQDPAGLRDTVEGVATIALWPLVVGFGVRNARRRERQNRALAVVRGYNDVHLAVRAGVKDLPDDEPLTSALLSAVGDRVDDADARCRNRSRVEQFREEYLVGLTNAVEDFDRFCVNADPVLDDLDLDVETDARVPTVGDLRRAVPQREVPDRFVSRHERQRRSAGQASQVPVP